MRSTESIPALLLGLALAAVGAVACGGAPPPALATASNAEASIRAARELGAQSDAQGALHLSLAQEELENGKKLIANGDPKRADLVIARSAADADLALAEARAAQSRAQTQQAADQVKLLKANTK